MLDLIKKSSPLMIVLVFCLYFFKVAVEKKIDGIEARVEAIGRTSLDVKKDMREAERESLVELRIAIDKWEFFMQNAVIDYTMMSPSKADVATLYAQEKELLGAVRIALVKSCVYLRDPRLEPQLLAAVSKLGQEYHRLVFQFLPPLIDAQARLIPLEAKMNKFKDSGFSDTASGLTEKDRAENLRLQTEMTAEAQKYSEELLKDYRDIAVQMNDLKESVNRYIYRPIEHAEIDKE